MNRLNKHCTKIAFLLVTVALAAGCNNKKKIDIVCADPPLASEGASTGTASAAPDPLSGCTRVTAIMSPAGGGDRRL